MTTVKCPYETCKFNDTGICQKKVIDLKNNGYSDELECSQYEESEEEN